MNTVLLNTVNLDDGRIIKKGDSGGVTIKNQTKSVTIAENGNTVVSYDSGYTGLEKVSVKVAIPNEEKIVDITENGTTEVVADNGFLSKVVVNTNVIPEGTIVSKDVDFYDYDGTLLHSYTWDEVVALTELPPLPNHEGLICKGWNYTLDEIKSQSHHMADVGAVYTTDDDTTRLYLNFEDSYNTDVSLCLSSIKSETVNIKISWGDNEESEIELLPSSTVNLPHVYGKAGYYTIKISGGIFYFGDGTEKGNGALGTLIAKRALWKIECPELNSKAYAFRNYIGLKYIAAERVNTQERGFEGCKNLQCLTSKTQGYQYAFANLTKLKVFSLAPKTTTPNNSNVYSGMGSLKRLVIPQGVSLGNSYLFANSGFKKLGLPDSLQNIGEYTFEGCTSLEELELRSAIYGKQLFRNCTNLKRVTFLSDTTSLADGFFGGCTALSNIKIPQGLKTIGASVFNNCSLLKEVSFLNHKNIPTLNNVNAFTGVHSQCEILVPTPLYNDWTSATNWSEIKDMIKSDYIVDECVSLNITADSVDGNKTSTIIRWEATTNGHDSFGNTYTNFVVKGESESQEFPQNTSESETVIRDIEFTLYGVTASTQMIHKPYVKYRIECLYNVTGTGNINIAYDYYWDRFAAHLDKMYVDDEEVSIPSNGYYNFGTIGEHRVAFHFKENETGINLYNLFYNTTTLLEISIIMDMKNMLQDSSTASSDGIQGICNNCSNLKTVTLPESIERIGAQAFYNCRNLNTLIIKSNDAPILEGEPFGSGSSTAGYNTRLDGINKLCVPSGAVGYDSSGWTSYLLNPSYGGFTIDYIEE
jgi:hypothetical protein